VPALALLSLDRRLPVFLAWATPSTLLVLGVGALCRRRVKTDPQATLES
jgi:predicted benzoate:H+ symporter BenE